MLKAFSLPFSSECGKFLFGVPSFGLVSALKGLTQFRIHLLALIECDTEAVEDPREEFAVGIGAKLKVSELDNPKVRSTGLSSL